LTPNIQIVQNKKEKDKLEQGTLKYGLIYKQIFEKEMKTQAVEGTV